MSTAQQILPSDKNEVECFAELTTDGRFDIHLPLTDGNRRERRITLIHFQTEGPFIPSSVQKFYDASENEGGIGEKARFYMMDVDVDKLCSTNITDHASSLPNTKWKSYNDVLDVYRSTPKDKGLIINTAYLSERMGELYDKIEASTDFNNYVQVFAEIGTKVTESQINVEKFNVELIKPDEMKMYLFPLDFYYPLISQTDHGANGTELDVGSSPALNYDEALRSMLRFALIDLNKGDVRTAFSESKRSAYLEYEVADPENPNKSITKYIYAWSMGNPFFYDCVKSPEDNGGLFRYLYLDKNKKKVESYGRQGTYLNLVGVNNEGNRGEMNNTYMHDFFADIGYTLGATSIYDSNKENCLMNVYRCNWGFVIAGALQFFLKNQSDLPHIGDTLSEVMLNIYKFDDKQIKGTDIFALMCGDLNIPGSYVSNIRSVSMFNRPSNMSFYGPDLVLRLMCDQVQTIVSGNKKRKNRLAQTFATLVSNEQTYQSFNSTDNRVVIQPPNFRPLLFMQQEQSLIVGASSRILNFYLLNADDQPVTFAPGERAYIRFKIEPV